VGKHLSQHFINVCIGWWEVHVVGISEGACEGRDNVSANLGYGSVCSGARLIGAEEGKGKGRLVTRRMGGTFAANFVPCSLC